MNYPDKDHSLALLKDWKAHHEAVEKLMDGIQEPMGLDPDGPLFGTVWKLFDAYTDTLSAELGDYSNTWLQWFCHENEMGRNGMEAGYDGKLKPIKTLAHLYALIAEERKRGGQ